MLFCSCESLEKCCGLQKEEELELLKVKVIVKIGRCLMLGWNDRFLLFRRSDFAGNPLGFLS